MQNNNINTKPIVVDEKREVIESNNRISQEENRLFSENYMQGYGQYENDYVNLMYSSDEYYQKIEEEIIEAFRCEGDKNGYK